MPGRRCKHLPENRADERLSVVYKWMKAPRQPTESSTLEAVLSEIHSTLRGRKQSKGDISSIIALYGSIMSLCARAKRVSAIIRAHRGDEPDLTVQLDCMNSTEVREFSGFFDELIEFGEHLNAVSIAVIDIYYPGLKDDLLNIVGRDMSFSWYYTNNIAPKYGLVEESLPITLFNFLDRFSGDWGPRNSGGHLMLQFSARDCSSSSDFNAKNDGLFYEHRDIPTAVFVDRFIDVTAGLERCRETISKIVREHWDFGDLASPNSSISMSIKGNLNMAETRYHVSNSQVGAIGPNAHVHDIAFHQALEQASKSIDSATLARELDQLKAELAQLASDRDHYAALVAVSDAAVNAKAGDGVGALGKLTAAGKWAFDVATKIGVSVAADAIKVAAGIK